MYKTKDELILEINKKYSKVGIFRRIFSWKDIMQNIENEINQLEDNGDILFKYEELKNRSENLEKSESDLQSTINKLNEDIDKQKIEIDGLTELKGVLKSQLESTNDTMVQYTKELHTVFKSSTGSQGKLSEKKLEQVFRGIFGEEGETWTTNLQVGDGRVEFAIKPDPTKDKWVPVDSKSLVPEVDENNEFVLDSKYYASVKKAGNDISEKYVSKNNTESYGIMVLPSEGIYNEIFYSGNESLIKDLSDKNIFITSPSNFIQFATTVYKLNERMNIVEKSKEIVSEISTAFDHLVNFHNNAKEGVQKINLAFDKHLPKATNKLEEIKDTIESTKKIN